MMIDSYEPVEIEALIKQVIPDSFRTDLNRNGLPDYCWYMFDTTLEGAERKQVGEVLSDMDGVEEQLTRELYTCKKLILIVEGVLEPKPGGCQSYILNKDGRYYRPNRFFKTQYSRYEGWLVSLERQGMLVWRTPSWIATAEALVRLQRSAERERHTALQRYVKPRPEFHPDPQVMSLMNIVDGGIGPELATRLIATFRTVYNVLRAPPELLAEQVDGMGLVRAKTLLRAAGRDV
mgnify:CR=1 FL=1